MKKVILVIVALLSGILPLLADHNETYSPDSSRVAFSRGGDLWVRSLDGIETRLTSDGGDGILNGRASWVYYEEIFGRSSDYRAFWWSPDSRRIAFYRFDESEVPAFPIVSPFGLNCTLSLTKYPKAGQPNPRVKIGIVDLSDPGNVVWADFPSGEDCYFGTPFWNDDSVRLFVTRMPRRQNTLELFCVDASTGLKSRVYKEEYSTWVDWMDEMLFDSRGLYIVRAFETGWQQIYYLSYDGKTFRRLTDGRNWDIHLLKVSDGAVWFLAKRDSPLHPALYRLDRRGRIKCLTDPRYYARNVSISDDGRTFSAELSNARTPVFHYPGESPAGYSSREEAESDGNPYPEVVRIENEGFDLYALLTLPKGYEPGVRYPVVMQVYGGPGTPYVRDWWKNRDATDRWCWENGIVYMVVDPRSSGENGRRGTDEAFRRMTVVERGDYLAWARWISSQPWADASRIGVEGFSFGGTMTAFLVLRYPEVFRCGVAGGGVYDWNLYDSHYTERFMETPEANPDGYDEASVIRFVETSDLASGPDSTSTRARLMLTHGTADDNVHLQNTLLLSDALQKAGVPFEMMLYPDGKHGYRGAQKTFSETVEHNFWLYHLKDVR